MCAGTVTDKYDNIKKWAETNNMKIHPSKTKELVVTRARTRSMHPPSKPFIEEAESYHTQSPWSPSQREIYHDIPRFTGFEHLLFFNVRVETSPDLRSPTARTPLGAWWLEPPPLHPFCMQPQRGGVSRVKGTVYVWIGS